MYNKVAYISGPFRAVDGEYGPFTPSILQHHRRIAEHWARILWRAGWVVICPHMNTRDMDGIGVSPEAFIRGDKTLLHRMAPGDMVFMTQNWQDSEGAKEECEAALEHGLRIVYAESLECNDDMVLEYTRRLYEDPVAADAWLKDESPA